MAQIPGSSQSREELLFARFTTEATVKGLGEFEGNAAVKGSFEQSIAFNGYVAL